METGDRSARSARLSSAPSSAARRPDLDGPPRPGSRHPVSARAGGTDGNEQLTAITGATLLVLLAIIGVTILRIGQLISVHLFVGLMLIGPVMLKMASTGYRFARYYSGSRPYREKGPPPAGLRLIAPGVVVSTLAVFVSGVVLLLQGPAHRSTMLLIHKAGFFVWLAVTGLHVLGHLPGFWTSFRGAASARDETGIPGTPGRWMALASAVVAGLVIAIVLIPQFSAWTAPGVLHHHHHGVH